MTFRCHFSSKKTKYDFTNSNFDDIFDDTTNDPLEPYIK